MQLFVLVVPLGPLDWMLLVGDASVPKRASNDLCCSLALVAHRLCTSCVDPDSITAMVACRLIALNKCPGVCPIGVGEVVRRIIAKAILSIVKLDVLEAAGSLQLCAGQDGPGCW